MTTSTITTATAAEADPVIAVLILAPYGPWRAVDVS